MSIFNFRRRRKQQKKNIFDDKADSRVQFNVLIEPELKSEIKKMAIIMRVNPSAMSGHLFEIGLHHMDGTIKDPDKRKLIEKHLEISHLLSEPDKDEDVVIRMTENNRNWILLDYTRQLAIRINRITKIMQNASIKQDKALFEKAERN